MIARPLPRPGPIPFGNTAMANPLPAASLNTVSRQASTGKDLSTHWRVQGHGGAATHSTAEKPGRAGHTGRSHLHAGAGHDNTDRQRGRELRATFHGHGVLSVRSSVTGMLYRFQGHGDTLLIDSRDALLLGRLSDIQVH